MHKVIHRFKDPEHELTYNIGDTYPARGKEATPGRVAYLESAENRIGVPLIREVRRKGKDSGSSPE